jgi:acetoacetyl-CoA synthetase
VCALLVWSARPQHTVNGKKVEVPIKKLLAGAALSSINASTLRNPECLDEYVELGKKLRAEVGM